jgi:4-hydroxy-tetrahydrodipicolinate synthase
LTSKRKELKGVQVLVPLPTREDYTIDLAGIKENARHVIDGGVDGVIALGSTGEFFQLSAAEFDKVVDATVAAVGGEVAVTVGCSYQNQAECLRRARYAERAGADGAMIMVPYYLPVSPEATLSFYKSVDESLDGLQVMVYNFPPASRVNIAPELWEDLLHLDSIRAVKESNSDIFHVSRVLSRVKSRVNVLAGSEAWMLPETPLGAVGVTSIFGTGLPELVVSFYRACQKNDFAKAVPMHTAFAEASWFITPYNEVAWVKRMAEICGRKAGPPRPPYEPLGPKETKFLRAWVAERNPGRR